MHLPKSILPETMSCSAGFSCEISTSSVNELSVQRTDAISPVISITSAKDEDLLAVPGVGINLVKKLKNL